MVEERAQSQTTLNGRLRLEVSENPDLTGDILASPGPLRPSVAATSVAQFGKHPPLFDWELDLALSSGSADYMDSEP
jgi:hypothetical protein